jgi:hypothetical protein
MSAGDRDFLVMEFVEEGRSRHGSNAVRCRNTT